MLGAIGCPGQSHIGNPMGTHDGWVDSIILQIISPKYIVCIVSSCFGEGHRRWNIKLVISLKYLTPCNIVWPPEDLERAAILQICGWPSTAITLQ